jgi:hypothetical protein
MNYSPILAPVVALVAWSLVMQVWMYAARIGAMRRAGIDMKGRRGSGRNTLEGMIPDEANWKAHNFAHLMEQPTTFYAVALSLALMDFGGGINLYLAWAYVGLRIVHSVIQATVNIILYRFAVFTLSSLCLLGLTVHTVAWLVHHGG